MTSFVLAHSPLVGPSTWVPVAGQLRARGHEVSTPHVSGEGWRAHAEAIATGIDAAGSDPVLAGHSGAGPLLPPARSLANRAVVAYIFVDAGIPEDGTARLDHIRRYIPEAADGFEAFLDAGGRGPSWTDEELAEDLPDPGIRRRVLAEIQPRGADFYKERLPVFDGWPDAPCAYLRFSDAYAGFEARALELGWTCREVPGGHFHMLVDPAAVAAALEDLAS